MHDLQTHNTELNTYLLKKKTRIRMGTHKFQKYMLLTWGPLLSQLA